jgi:hypothetical protein
MQKEEEDLAQLVKQLQALAIQEESVLNSKISANPSTYIPLLEAINTLASKSCGNANKCAERVTALKIQLLYPHYSVEQRKCQYGSEILIVNRESGLPVSIVAKSSLCEKGKQYKSNWNFTVPSYKTVKAALEMDEDAGYHWETWDKIGGVFVSLHATSMSGDLNVYVIDTLFLSLVLCKIALDKHSGAKVNINLGGKRCSTCLHYHRIQKLQRYEAVYAKRSGEKKQSLGDFSIFTPEEWNDLLGKTSACKQ